MSPDSTDPLALPLSLPCGARLRHRLVKASMEEALATPSLDPSEGLVRATDRFARGGAALLLTGHVIVDRAHRARPGDVVLDERSDLAAFEAWAEAARRGGGLGFVQLNHAGRQAPRFVHPAPLAPSAVAPVKVLASFGRPRAMRDEDVVSVIEQFASSAARCERAGWDGVEIHAAHGYLLSQFLSPLTNLRSDRWGGAIEGRARLLLEVVRGVRARTGPRFGVAVKLNSADFQRGGFDADDFAAVVALLDREGIDLLEISGGNYESPALLGAPSDGAPAASGAAPRARAREAYFLEMARAVRGLTRVPLLLTGGLRTRGGMEQALAEGIDLVGLARPLALEPDLPRELLARRTERARVEPVRVRARTLRALADTAWSWRQIVRMAEGRDPDPTLSPLASVAAYLAEDLARAAGLPLPRPRRPPAARAEARPAVERSWAGAS